ncbi:hydantoinase/oxoprolinase family protein [Pelomyxa schiedti]|nr:hydantoinase/oxoprolinase family protein [Pelomyxa schiedti]
MSGAAVGCRVSSDVGGTFTDVAVVGRDGRLVVSKSPSTPSDFSQGVMAAVDLARSDLRDPEAPTDFFVHGATVVINALTERKGAKTGLITTKGFRDVLEITRANRPDLFNMMFEKPIPFVPRRLRVEVEERIDYKGRVVKPLQEASVTSAINKLLSEGVESIAVCLLHSYVYPDHEKKIGELISKMAPNLPFTLSCAVSREWREYERTSTTVLNSFVLPVAGKYLGAMEETLHNKCRIPLGALHVMQSNGGCTTFTSAKHTPISMVESGPVAGVIGSAFIASLVGESSVISFDVGGTTAKTSLVQDGIPNLITEYKIERDREHQGYPIQVPTVDIVEIGSGGGSIAFWDTTTNVLRVGEQSAGAVPGPACYNFGGTQPTITDANLIIGRLNPDYFVGGQMRIDVERSRRAIEPIAQHAGVSIEEAALGIIQLSDAKKVNMIKLISVQRGIDPRNCCLICHGGGGPVHAAAMARELRCKKVIVPPNPGVFSAVAMLMLDIRHDTIVTGIRPTRNVDLSELNDRYIAMQKELESLLLLENVSPENISFLRFCDMRYKGQEHCVKVPFPSGTITAEAIHQMNEKFHTMHLEKYTFKLSQDTEFVNYHVTAIGKVSNLKFTEVTGGTTLTIEGAFKGERGVWFEGYGCVPTKVYQREKLPLALDIHGPVIIEEHTSSTIVYPDQIVRRDNYGFLHLQADASCVTSSLPKAVESMDKFIFEIIQESITAISDEMFLHMKLTSMSTIIYEVLDFATGLIDANGNMITQGNGVAGFLGTLTFAVRSVLAKFAGKLLPGDVIISNNPYDGGGTHLSDVTLIKPIFFENKLVCFAANKAHWSEVGGMCPGSWTTNSTDIWQEGLHFPCIKLYNQGIPNESLLDLIKVNVRTPEASIGDMMAQVSSLSIAESRFTELCQRYTWAVVDQAVKSLLTQGELLTREALAKVTPGDYYSEDWIDDDGLGNGPFKLCVKVKITPEKFICDFTGCPPPVPGPINTGMSALAAAVRCLYMATVKPKIRVNEGCFAPLEIICPKNTLLSASAPAPVSTYWETMDFGADLVWKALAPSMPTKLPAGHFLSVCGTIISGIHPDTGELFILVEPQIGGWGAAANRDGQNALVCIGDGETYIIPVEICEMRYGVMVAQLALVTPDGGCGSGQFRGGNGVVREYTITAKEANVTGTFGRFKYPPWGMHGGSQGGINCMIFKQTGKPAEVTGKAANRRVLQGESVEMVTGCGGGYGDPLRRDRQAIAEDISNGYITLQQATDIYHYTP